MIHSMSGGIIKDPGSYTFVKVTVDGEESSRWYLSDIPVAEGDTVTVPFGRADMPRRAKVIRVENNVSGQITPVPLKTAKKIIGVVLE